MVVIERRNLKNRRAHMSDSAQVEAKKTSRIAFSKSAKVGGLILAGLLIGGVAMHLMDDLNAPDSDASKIADMILQRDLAIAYANHEQSFYSGNTIYGVSNQGGDNADGCYVGAVKAIGYDINSKPNSFEDDLGTAIRIACPKP
jgi:hypothetical protein